jgi:hypothetical protein
VQNTHDAHLPVDLGGALLAEKRIGCPALRAAPLVLGNVVDDLFGLEPRVVPTAMPGAAGLLAPPAAPVALKPPRNCRRHGRVSPGTLGLVLLLLLRRGAEAELGERRDLLRCREELTFEIDDSRL